MINWEQVRLGQIVEILSSKRVFASDYSPDGVPFWRGKEVVELSAGREISTELYISEDTYQTLGKKIGFPKAGDILLTSVGTLGRAYMLTGADRIYFKDGNLTWFRNYSKRLHPSWLLYWMRSEVGQSSFERTKIGSTQQALTIINLKSLAVSLPSLPEQRSIAATLGALDDKIELNRKMNATLEAMARALFRDWFVDFGPTRAKMAGTAPYLSPDLWSLFPDRLDGEGKPEGWEEKPLTEFFSIIGGGTPKTSNPDFWDGSIPWFSVTDTPSTGSVFVTDTEKTITEAGLKGSSARLVPKGTTIISARGTVGNLAVTGRDMTFNQSCYGLSGAGGVGDCATYLIAQNMVARLQSMAHGSVFSTITRQTFESLSLPMPKPKVLAAFEIAVSLLFDRILANVNESRTLSQTRDLLLPKLMSGEIRLGGTEGVV